MKPDTTIHLLVLQCAKCGHKWLYYDKGHPVIPECPSCKRKKQQK